MDTTANIPLTVTTEAAERIAELGCQTEFERMLEHARQVIVALQGVEVYLVPPYDTGDEPGIIIQASCDPAARQANAPTKKHWRRWIIETFSPDVYRHFVLFIVYGAQHAGSGLSGCES